MLTAQEMEARAAYARGRQAYHNGHTIDRGSMIFETFEDTALLIEWRRGYMDAGDMHQAEIEARGGNA